MAEKKETPKRRIYVPACPDCSSACIEDEDGADVLETLIFEIPGADKEKMQIHVAEDRMRLIAPRKNSDVEYVSEYLFNCPVKKDGKSTASYEDGLLKVEVPLVCESPYKDAVKVKVN